MSKYIDRGNNCIVEAFVLGKEQYPPWFVNRIGSDVRLSDDGGILAVIIREEDKVFSGEYIVKGSNGDLNKLGKNEFDKIYMVWKTY